MILAKPTSSSPASRRDGTASPGSSQPTQPHRRSGSGHVISPREGTDPAIAAQASLLSLALERPEPGIAVVRMRGEIDLSSAPRLTELVQQRLTAAKLRALVLDLSEVSFLNSSALEVILHAQRRAEYRGIKMYLVPGASPFDRLLQITELTGRFTRRATVAEAVAEIQS